jgi:YHS domain-containing protein
MRFLILLLIGYLVYRMVRGKAAPEIAKEPAATETFQDPVCGVYVSESDAVVGKMGGRRYHFCSIGCLQQFEKAQQQR